MSITICTNKLKIPAFEDKQRIIEEYHSSTTEGHLGISKTYLRLHNRFFWGGGEDIENFVVM